MKLWIIDDFKIEIVCLDIYFDDIIPLEIVRNRSRNDSATSEVLALIKVSYDG